MQRAYEREYGVKSVILRHGFEKPFAPSDKNRKQEIVIAYAGSVYGRDAWEAFLPVVAQLNRSGKYPPIIFRVFGGGNFHLQQHGVTIEVMGWQPAEVMLQAIADCDFCYLTYWFDTKKRRHTELSFPNKFETYLAAGRPILFHGPSYAGIAESIREYGVGLNLHSLEQQEIMANLETIIANVPLRDSFTAAATNAFYKEFNADVMLRNYYELISRF